MLSLDLSNLELQCKTITLKIKTSTFQVLTRSKSFPRPVSSKEDIYFISTLLLKSCGNTSIRLLGIRASNLTSSKTENALEKFLNKKPIQDLVSCPICNEKYTESNLNLHLDSCLNGNLQGSKTNRNSLDNQPKTTQNQPKIDSFIFKSNWTCPICLKSDLKIKTLEIESINAHLDACLNLS